VFQVVVVVLEGALGVVGRVDEDALDLAAMQRQQGLEGLQVVALDQQVVGGGARVPYRLLEAVNASWRPSQSRVGMGQATGWRKSAIKIIAAGARQTGAGVVFD